MKAQITPACIYEVNIRQYTPEGSFRDFMQHLPRLQKMGIDMLWLMPVTPIAQRNKKGTLGSPYAASDYTAINAEFGTAEDFQVLVDAAHRLGMRIIIDWVANHTGWDHVWTKKYPTFYKKNSDTGDFQTASGMDDIIELDYENPQMRQEMIRSMQYWTDAFGIDGFRCDLAAWVPAVFWQQVQQEWPQAREMFWLGEFDVNENPEYGPYFNACYSWRWMHTTKQYVDGTLSFQDLLKVLDEYIAQPTTCQKLWFTSNHDENSWNGTEYEKYGRYADALAVFSFTFPGLPLLYTGQELPLIDHRLAFFDRDPLQWPTTPGKEAFFKTLIDLSALSQKLQREGATLKFLHPDCRGNCNVLAYLISTEKSQMVVFLNLGGEDADIHLQENMLNGQYRELFTELTFPLHTIYDKTIPPGAYIVLTSI